MPPRFRRGGIRHAVQIGCLAVIAALLQPLLCQSPAQAGAWAPAAGSGETEPMLRYSYADRSFPPAAFTSATLPSTKEHETQIRLRGEHGLGDGFFLDYDLRYGFLYRSKTKKGIVTVDTNDGLQDQRIGLDYALTQDEDFADALGLSVVIPGSSAVKIPGLDSGHWALEPVYQIGFKPGFWQLMVEADLGSRVFTDGGVAQFRSHVEIAAPVLHRLRLAGKLLFVRSARLGGYDDVRDHGELYNLFRAGVEAKYRLSDGVEPFIAYEANLAGMGGHSSQRFTIGIKLKY